MSSLLGHLDNKKVQNKYDQDEQIDRLFPKCKPKTRTQHTTSTETSNCNNCRRHSFDANFNLSVSDNTKYCTFCSATNTPRNCKNESRSNVNSISHLQILQHEIEDIKVDTEQDKCVSLNLNSSKLIQLDNTHSLLSDKLMSLSPTKSSSTSTSTSTSTGSSIGKTEKKHYSSSGVSSEEVFHHHHHHRNPFDYNGFDNLSQNKIKVNANNSSSPESSGSSQGVRRKKPSMTSLNPDKGKKSTALLASRGGVGMDCEEFQVVENHHFDNGLLCESGGNSGGGSISGGSSGSGGGSFSEKNSLKNQNSSSILRDSKIEIAGGREIYSQNRIKANRRLKSTTIPSHNNVAFCGGDKEIDPSSAPCLNMSLSDSRPRKKSPNSPQIYKSQNQSADHNEQSLRKSSSGGNSSIWEPNTEIDPGESPKNNPFSCGGSSSSGINAGQIRNNMKNRQFSYPPPTYGHNNYDLQNIHQHQQQQNDIYSNSNRTSGTINTKITHSQSMKMNHSNPPPPRYRTSRGDGLIFPQIHQSEQISPQTIKETVFSSEITSIEKSLKGSSSGGSSSSGSGAFKARGSRSRHARGHMKPSAKSHFIYEEPSVVHDHGEVIFDDIDETGGGRSVNSKWRKKQIEEMEEECGDEDDVEDLNLSKIQSSSSSHANCGGNTALINALISTSSCSSQANPSQLHLLEVLMKDQQQQHNQGTSRQDLEENNTSPSGYESDEFSARQQAPNVLDEKIHTNTNNHSSSPTLVEKPKLVDFIPIAEYEGSPKRYGVKQNNSGIPGSCHIDLVDSTGAEVHLKQHQELEQELEKYHEKHVDNFQEPISISINATSGSAAASSSSLSDSTGSNSRSQNHKISSPRVQSPGQICETYSNNNSGKNVKVPGFPQRVTSSSQSQSDHKSSTINLPELSGSNEFSMGSSESSALVQDDSISRTITSGSGVHHNSSVESVDFNKSSTGEKLGLGESFEHKDSCSRTYDGYDDDGRAEKVSFVVDNHKVVGSTTTLSTGSDHETPTSSNLFQTQIHDPSHEKLLKQMQEMSLRKNLMGDEHEHHGHDEDGGDLNMDNPYDYLYEFSETRKVLEEFFKPHHLLHNNSFLNNRGDFDELDYSLKRQTGNSYVGQRLAGEALVEESPKKHAPPRRGFLSLSTGCFTEHSNPSNPPSKGSDNPSEESPKLLQFHEVTHHHGHHQQLDQNRDVNYNDIELDNEETASTNTETDLGDTEVGLQVGQSRNFTLSPETTDCDSNELESEISLDYEASMNSSRIGTIMPVLEDGLSSGNVSENDMDNEDGLKSFGLKGHRIYNNAPTILQLHQQRRASTNSLINSNNNNNNCNDVVHPSNVSNPTLILMKKQITEIEKEFKMKNNSQNGDSGDGSSGGGQEPFDSPPMIKTTSSSTTTNGIFYNSSSGVVGSLKMPQRQAQPTLVSISPVVDGSFEKSDKRLLYNNSNDPDLDALDPMRITPPPSPAPTQSTNIVLQQSRILQNNTTNLSLNNHRESSGSNVSNSLLTSTNSMKPPEHGLGFIQLQQQQHQQQQQDVLPNQHQLQAIHQKSEMISPGSSGSGSSNNSNSHKRMGTNAMQDIKDAIARSKHMNRYQKLQQQDQECKSKPGNRSHHNRSGGGDMRDPLLKDRDTPDDDADTDQETDRLLGQNRNDDDYGFYDDKEWKKASKSRSILSQINKGVSSFKSSTPGIQTSSNNSTINTNVPSTINNSKSPSDQFNNQQNISPSDPNCPSSNNSVSSTTTTTKNKKEKDGVKKKRSKEDLNPTVLIEGVLFRARYLGSTQLVCEGQPTKATRMIQAEEAVSRIKAGAEKDKMDDFEDEKSIENCEIVRPPRSLSSPSTTSNNSDEESSPTYNSINVSEANCIKNSQEIASQATRAFEEYLNSLPNVKKGELNLNLSCGEAICGDKISDEEDEDEVNYVRPAKILTDSTIDKKRIIISDHESEKSDNEEDNERRTSRNCIVNDNDDTSPETEPEESSGGEVVVGGQEKSTQIQTQAKYYPPLSYIGPPCGSALPGTMFRLKFVGSLEVEEEIGSGKKRCKRTKKEMVEEAVAKLKAPEDETQPSTEVDLFISTEKIMVLNTDLKEIMMDHALRTISYIADIGDLVVLMARRRPIPSDVEVEDSSSMPRPPKMICHVFESDEAQYIAQSIGQAFQVAYMEFLKANGIEDHSFVREMDYQEVLNSQEIFGDELQMFAKKELQKEVVVPKSKGEILGVVIVESGWGSMLPTVVIANLQPGGAAARCGHLNIGDQIIAINGISLVGLPLSTCQTYIKNTKKQNVLILNTVPCPPVVEVKIKRPDTKYQLGFSVQNGVICSLLRGGIAERGGVRVGHRIIEINSNSVVAVPHEKIVNLLATSVGEINMKTMPTSMFRLLTGQETPLYI